MASRTEPKHLLACQNVHAELLQKGRGILDLRQTCGSFWPSSFSPPWKACHFWDLGWQGGWGGGGRGGNYVRNTRIPCNLQCFLVAQILAKKPRLRRRLETMRVLQCFLCQQG